MLAHAVQLTRVLEPCLTGAAKTLMVVNVADAVGHRDSNVQTLRFGASMTAVALRRKPSQRDVRAARKTALTA